MVDFIIKILVNYQLNQFYCCLPLIKGLSILLKYFNSHVFLKIIKMNVKIILFLPLHVNRLH